MRRYKSWTAGGQIRVIALELSAVDVVLEMCRRRLTLTTYILSASSCKLRRETIESYQPGTTC